MEWIDKAIGEVIAKQERYARDSACKRPIGRDAKTNGTGPTLLNKIWLQVIRYFYNYSL